MRTEALFAELKTIEWVGSDCDTLDASFEIYGTSYPVSGDMIARIRAGTPNDVAGRIAVMNAEVNRDPGN